MRHLPQFVTAAFVAAVLAASAPAQVVPPVPSRTPPTPEYQPPKPVVPPTPTRITPPAESTPPPANDKPLPSLIEKDSAGKIKPVRLPVDEAAVRSLGLDDETMAKVEKSIAARRDEIDRMVIEKIDALMAIHKTMAELPASPDMDTMRQTTMSARTFNNNKLLDRLVKDGALPPAEKARAAQVAREYSEARKTEIVGEVGHDVMKMVKPAFTMSVEEATFEADLSLDRQLAAAAPNQEAILAKVDMPADRRSDVNKRLAELKKKPAAGVTPEQQRATVLRGIFFDVLKPDQQRAFLTAASPRLFEEKPAEPKPADQPAGQPPKK